MKILAVIGSMRKNGSTYQVVKRLEEQLVQHDSGLEFDYVFLGDEGIEMCRGCSLCFKKGEAHCPCKDDVPDIVRRMHQADGVIFACPAYVANVPGVMKNFIDRLAYFCHRPAFFDKKALLVTTVGVSGSWQALNTMNVAASVWGYKVVGKLNIVTGTNSAVPVPEKYYASITKTADKFYRSLSDGKKISPNIQSLTVFKYRTSYYRKNNSTYDAEYWRSKGWLEPGKRYFCDARINIFKSFAASIIAAVVELTGPRI